MDLFRICSSILVVTYLLSCSYACFFFPGQYHFFAPAIKFAKLIWRNPITWREKIIWYLHGTIEIGICIGVMLMLGGWKGFTI